MCKQNGNRPLHKAKTKKRKSGEEKAKPEKKQAGKPAGPLTGKRVRIKGLKSKPELNGTFGMAGTWTTEGKERYKTSRLQSPPTQIERSCQNSKTPAAKPKGPAGAKPKTPAANQRHPPKPKPCPANLRNQRQKKPLPRKPAKSTPKKAAAPKPSEISAKKSRYSETLAKSAPKKAAAKSSKPQCNPFIIATTPCKTLKKQYHKQGRKGCHPDKGGSDPIDFSNIKGKL